VQSLVPEVGYIALPDEVITKVQARLASQVAGSMYEGKPQKPGTTLAQLLQ
jgi:hypothetical protein